MRDELMRLLEPVLAALGYELVELEYLPSGGGALLRVYIDHLPGYQPDRSQSSESEEVTALDGLTLDDCERASREMSAVLDAEDPIRVEYTLEVSSPGLDRILRTDAHFARFQGERVKLELTQPLAGRRRFSGRLLEAGSGKITLEVDGTPVTFGLEQIRRARLAPP